MYATICWPRLQHTPAEVELADTIKYVEMGYRAIKLQIWRDNPYVVIEMLQHLRDRFGGPDKVQFMFDRTASLPGSLWDVETALEVARGLQFLQAGWLEEPLQHGDVHGYARLSDSVDLPISAGERDFGLEPFIRYGTHKALDIWQPDAWYSGGILMVHRIAALAEGFHVPLLMHGGNHLLLAPVLQLAASISTCRLLEVAMITPPFRPEEQWQPLRKLVNTQDLFEVRGDMVKVPTLPGLGVDVNEDAVLEYRVPPSTPRRPDAYNIRRPIFLPDDYVRAAL
jgi:D-galactarolactone cycloisomerase